MAAFRRQHPKCGVFNQAPTLEVSGRLLRGRNPRLDEVLQAQYRALALEFAAVVGDGDCLFHAAGLSAGRTGRQAGSREHPKFECHDAATLRAAAHAFLTSDDARAIQDSYVGAFDEAEWDRAVVDALTPRRPVGSAAVRALAVHLGRHIILLNGVPECDAYDAAVYSPDAAWVHPEHAELYSTLNFLELREFLEKLGTAVVEPVYLVWDGVGHFDAVTEAGAFNAAVRARGAAGAGAAGGAGASPAGRAARNRGRPDNVVTEDATLATSPPGSANRGGGGPCPHALFVNEPEDISAAKPVACPFGNAESASTICRIGINCTIGVGRGGNCVFKTQQSFRAHGTWHMKREAAVQARAANATYVGDASDSDDDAGPCGGPVPGPPSRDAYAELHDVQLEEALEPGHRTVDPAPAEANGSCCAQRCAPHVRRRRGRGAGGRGQGAGALRHLRPGRAARTHDWRRGA